MTDTIFPGFVLKDTPITKNGPHCWQDGPRHPQDGMSTTCMLKHGHRCAHRWWRNDDISISMKQAEKR